MEKNNMAVYRKFEHLDIKDEASLLRHRLDAATCKNVNQFSNLEVNLFNNFFRPAFSPFSGEIVQPQMHFGIDSDPWMHSILYNDNGREFIIVCQGLTPASHLGSIVLPKEKLLLDHYDSWYYGGAYLVRIERNLPRILNHFRYRKKHKENRHASKPFRINFAIGNQRVGDYIMQLLLLGDLLRHKDYRKQFVIDQIFVNRSSEFAEVESLFEELAPAVKKLKSFSHIEYHSRYFPGTLFSDIQVLSNRQSLKDFKTRVSDWVNQMASSEKFRQLAAPLKHCKLVIWVGLELEKRVWAEQEEGIIEIIRHLSVKLKNGDQLGVIFNGITGYTAQPLSAALEAIAMKERRIMKRIGTKLPSNVFLYPAIGLTMSDKFVLANLCEFICAPIGSASIIPSLLLDKPGIVYAFDAMDRAVFAGPSTHIFSTLHITERPDLRPEVHFQTANQSYSFDWQDLLNEINDQFDFSKSIDDRITVSKIFAP